ncbi:hypothetical protein LY78DRAFT_93611 [Colletotrichum sublineola]|nr:hypothetical protein LY78DRAFT_93611 [Colletotrichum sublineola]
MPGSHWNRKHHLTTCLDIAISHLQRPSYGSIINVLSLLFYSLFISFAFFFSRFTMSGNSAKIQRRRF